MSHSVKPTPRSSITIHDNGHEPHTKSSDHWATASNSGPLSPLDQEIFDDEKRIERYGADDIEEPTPKSPVVEGAAGSSSPPPIPVYTHKVDDPNMVTWDGPDDPENPQNWSDGYKWMVTMICVLLSLNVSFSSSAPTSATYEIIAAFNISMETSYAIVTLFLVGFVFGPILWGPGSELVGRRPIFMVSLSCYTLFHLGQALSQNIQTLLICRFFAGFFAVAPLTISGGVIADIWPALGRGPATSIFSASVFLGPVLGPLVGGFIVESTLGWRWVFWIMMIFAGTCTLLMLAFLPETYAPVILSKKTKKLRQADPEATKDIFSEHDKQDWSIKGLVHRTIYRPFQMLAMEPILVLVTIYLSLVYGVLYALFEAIPIVFGRTRGFTISQNGLVFIGVGIGTTLGSIINVFCSRHYPTLVKKWKGFPPPEQRLFGAMIGGPLLVIGAFWLGWTGQYASIPWYVPALSTIFIGAAICLIFISFLSYLVDTYLMYAASAFAANTIMRSLVAAAFPLFTVQMFTKLGTNWAATLIGLVGLVLMPSPFLFYKYGPRIRARSKFAPCIDLKIAKELELEERTKNDSEHSGQEKV